MKYYEKQTFNQKWLIVTTYAILVLCILLFIVIAYFEKKYLVATIILMIGAVLFCLLKYSYLILKIDQNTIQYRFFPFHSNFKNIDIDNSLQCEVIPYDPISEFGGWGIRVNKKAKCYSISGTFVLKIVKPGQKLLYLGTNKPEELRNFIEQRFKKQ